MTDATVIPLQQFYLAALIAVAGADGLTAVQQENPQRPTMGRLYLVKEGSTRPFAALLYNFGDDGVSIGAMCGARETAWNRTYLVGIDDVLPELQKFLRADLLTDKRATSRR